MRNHRYALRALAVTAILATGFIFTAETSAPTAPATATTSVVIPTHVGEPPDSLAGYDVAVESYWRWIETSVYLEAVVAQEQAAAEHAAAIAAEHHASAPATVADLNGIPGPWVPTAICEESGRDDPYAGYFGILAWGKFDGYPTAGSAPLNTQLAWEAAHGQGPPDAPGQCHSY